MDNSYIVAGTVALSFLAYKAIKQSQRRLPPGPPGYPLIGNALDVSDKLEWLSYRDMGKAYNSDIIYFNVFGTSFVVVNSYDAAQELFEKRSAIYSDRPRFTMLNELAGMAFHVGFMPYNDEWKEHRKAFRKEFQPPSTEAHRPGILLSIRTLLPRLLDTPLNFDRHLRHMTGQFIMTTSYGIDVVNDPTRSDPYVTIGERCLQAMAGAGNSTQFLVDQIPIMKYIPEWVPGAKFQTMAREWRKDVVALPNVPWAYVKKAMSEGNAKPCVATRYIDDMQTAADGKEIDPEQEKVCKGVLGAAYAAATDTTVSALETVILAMVQNPEVVKKAQKAVDEVIGDRLPDFSDLNTVPYVTAIVKEALRWKPVTPLAVPHRLMEDDVYNGYDLPKGAVVIGNAWAMLYDESVYGPDVDKFRPERFLTKDGQLDPNVRHPDVAFGFGRRSCPGNDIAEMSMWVTVATLLVCFDFGTYVDPKTGKEEAPSGEYTSGMLCYPLPFKLSLKPRSQHVVDMIRNDTL
ncbi:hypothetical protein AAF712_003741 [Marasmius tenuissimus]|uniref:Cytochrome P450 n=1 Tax=Marasmius tenuissimus TaxID=585030 RepID=A0ABR3A5W9_9AGAR|nr:hypothetical protein PM082_017136 [Marasmius tenuissimus]